MMSNDQPQPSNSPGQPPPGVRNIVLTGFMGTGKTTVGRRLAELLGWTLVDTDDLIVERAGKPITRIFAEDGEPAFRAIESQIARETIGLNRHVISTGGGLILAEGNLRTMEAAGAVVHLEASPETVWERVREETHRPLLDKPDPQEEIRRLLDARAEAYGRVRIRIATDGKTPDRVAEEIVKRVRGATNDRETKLPNVDLGERSYPIRIGRGWIGALGETLASSFQPCPCVLVSDSEVASIWGRPVLDSLRRAGYDAELCELPAGEDLKTLDTVGLIYDHVLRRGADRQSAVIALGGGVVGDIAGFAAATLLRGIAVVQIPTTLLAMVDSSVGGKTGVNHPAGKNLIGAFWQPTFVGIDLLLLATLPDDELRAGLAEVIKYGVIADAEMFKYIEENLDRALVRDGEVLAHLVQRSCEIKADVVARDEREGGVRAILNFGHTIGHAAEVLTNYNTLRHGEAVAMGMVAATHMAQERSWIDAVDVDRIEALVSRTGLPVRLPKFSPDEYWDAMRSDKKVRDGRPRFILPDAIGSVRLADDVTRAETLRCISHLMARA